VPLSEDYQISEVQDCYLTESSASNTALLVH